MTPECCICQNLATHECLLAVRGVKRVYCRNCALIHRRSCPDCKQRRQEAEALKSRSAE